MTADLHVVMPWYGSFAGGASAALTSIATAIRSCGFSVEILTSCSKSPYQDWQNSVHEPGVETIDGISVRRFPVDRSDTSGYHAAVSKRMRGEEVDESLQDAFFREGLNSSALVDFVSGLPSDARILAGPYFHALVPTLVNAQPGRIMVMSAFHDEPELRWRPIANLVRNARGFLFLTDEEKALAILHHGAGGGRRLVESPVTGLGVALPESLRSEELLDQAGAEAMARLALPRKYFLYCGRIEFGKGLDYLLPWFARWSAGRLSRGQEPVSLALMGGGDEKIVPPDPNIRYVGYLSPDDKFALMRGAVGLINPSKLESFSYVVMESWLAGKPVIVPAQCAVTAGHVRRSGGGVAFQDEVEFGAALDQVLRMDVNRELGGLGARYVRQRYAWPQVLDSILEALGMAVT